ncbi:MAG: type secretion system protein GspD, partial [Deltaproteobacteria bacterium]|nr:type secretion system protein GspD [Deltaproteobacteria bacterium]
FEVSLKSGRGVGITFTPIARINSLLVVSGIPNILDKVESWLTELDRIPSEGSKLSVFVYYVQNGKAKDLADVLKQIYVSAKDKKTEFKEKVTPTTPATQRSVRPTTPAATATKEETGIGGVVEGDINIVVDENTNALIIRAFQRDYYAIVETIKKLDLYPKQVLIEVLLAEVTLDETTKYGLEWSTFTDSFVRGGRTYAYTVGMGGIAPATDLVSGLRYSITSVDRLAAAIHASATDNRLKVITSPHIMASNNKEAKIQIGSSEPILTNTYTSPYATTGTTTGSTSFVEGTIEYKDIGVILSVTPRISDGKLVTMDINIEQSTVDSKALGNLPSIPFFPKKTAKTTLSISEGQTIVIGGLLDDTKNVKKSGVPFLSKIPILGALFGYHQYEDRGTETILMLTPHVITDLIESNRVTQEFREKVGAIKKELEVLEKKRMEGTTQRPIEQYKQKQEETPKSKIPEN